MVHAILGAPSCSTFVCFGKKNNVIIIGDPAASANNPGNSGCGQPRGGTTGSLWMGAHADSQRKRSWGPSKCWGECGMNTR